MSRITVISVSCFTHMTEALHFLENLVDIWHHILAIHHDGSVGAVPQSHMEHSTALRMHREAKPTETHLTIGTLYCWQSRS